MTIWNKFKKPSRRIESFYMQQKLKLIKKGSDGIFLLAAKIKSKSKVQPINSPYDTVVIKEGKYINLKPTVLFTWLTAVAQRKDD